MYGKDRIWFRTHHSSCLWGRSEGNGQRLKERGLELEAGGTGSISGQGIPTSGVNQKKKKKSSALCDVFQFSKMHTS